MSKKFDKMAEALEMIKAMSRNPKADKKEELVQESEVDADVNGDGTVDEKDVEEVKKKISKKKKAE